MVSTVVFDSISAHIKAQLVLAAVVFTFIGYSVSVFAVHQGGYLSALIMGIVTSLSYRGCSTQDEIEFL